jgi:hypothetical protein
MTSTGTLCVPSGYVPPVRAVAGRHRQPWITAAMTVPRDADVEGSEFYCRTEGVSQGVGQDPHPTAT